MGAPTPTGRWASAVGLALLLWTLSAGAAGAAPPSTLRVEVTGVGGARLAGDHETITATVTNGGPTPLHDVLVMLSLVDVTASPAVPLGLEDWTPDPTAAHAATLAPGAMVGRTWRLRMIQGGTVAAYATVVAGDGGAVRHSRPLVLTVEPTHNLTPARVLPVAFGIPLVTMGAVAAVRWRHRARSGCSRYRGDSPGIGGIRSAGTVGPVVALLTALTLGGGPSSATAATSASARPAGDADELRPRLTLVNGLAATKTGDRRTATAAITNTTDRVLRGATLFLGLVDATPGQSAPLGLETWTTDPESVALPPLAPGASASASWRLVMIQPGPLGLYATVMPGPHGPVESSPLTVVWVKDVRVLNPGRVLPVALGEPVIVLGLLGLVRARRASRVDRA
jgi:hypothetical protein